jgi:K+-sensing histidine kinase KdpD
MALPEAGEHPDGYPSLCWRDGASLYFSPVPLKAWTVHVTYRATLTLGAAAEATISVAGFDQLIIAWATAYVFGTLELGRESAKFWRGVFEERIIRKLVSQEMGGRQDRINLRLVEHDGPPDNPAAVAGVNQVTTWWPEGR